MGDLSWEPGKILGGQLAARTKLREELTSLKNDTNKKGFIMISDFWDQVRNNGKWRIWKDLGYREDNPLKDQVDSLAMDLE